jgi:hypothetical protein
MTWAVDFDGVVHAYSDGWRDGTIYGPPLPGAIDGLRTLMGHDAVFIHTARDPAQVVPWLEQHGLEATDDVRCLPCWTRASGAGTAEPVTFPWDCPACGGTGTLTTWTERGRLLVTSRKFPALAYVDDHALPFTDWPQLLAALLPPPAPEHP